MLELQLFAEENAAETAADDTAQASGDEAPVAGEQEDFETLIKGRYKEQFDARVHRILDGRLRGLRRENEQLRQEQQRRVDSARHAFAKLEAQEAEVQAIYPDFDWRREVCNPAFGRMIEAGVDARTAYEVVHQRELMHKAMAYSAKRAARQAAQTVASGRHRVQENGRGGASISRSDPRELDSRQLADIRKRVMDGEKIRF